MITKEKFIQENMSDDAPVFKILSENLNCDIDAIRKLQKKYANELKTMQNIRNIYKNKLNENNKNQKNTLRFVDFKQFYRWYMQYDKIATCCYCGVHKDVANNSKIFNDSKRGRGKVLEVERVVTNPIEKNVYSVDNCRLACHICNNAKSDFLSPKDFKPIAKGISDFWKDQDVHIEFPDKSSIWDMI